jgi:CheY-like chemotaxis protein
LLLCDDLMFTSRISGTAGDLGLTVKAARSVEALEALLQQEVPSCVIVDLALAGRPIADFIRRLRPARAAKTYVVAYGSHVDAATLRAAREAGCDVVLPRSKFVESLAQALPQWLAGTG